MTVGGDMEQPASFGLHLFVILEEKASWRPLLNRY
jgi:hypothetical protein